MTGSREQNMWSGADHVFPADRLDDFLVWAAGEGASDVSFQTGAPAMIEKDGRLLRASRAILDGVVLSLLADRVHGGAAEAVLRSGRAIDCSHAAGTARGRQLRFRCNVSAILVAGGFGINMTLRVLPDRVPRLAELSIEPEIASAWDAGDGSALGGLTLVTGVPGSGKSTLLAAGTRHLLETGAGRIQSFESPIEFVFDGIAEDGALMSSSEIPMHFADFADGLRSALRRRPAAVIVGEARDRETMEAVVRAADFGISVYATTHTIGVAATVRRMLAEFAPDERPERGAALIDVLNLIVTQCLFPAPGGGRTAIREWLRFDGALKAMLLDKAQHQWTACIQHALDETGNTLAAAALRASGAGRLHASDCRRVQFMSQAGADSRGDWK